MGEKRRSEAAITLITGLMVAIMFLTGAETAEFFMTTMQKPVAFGVMWAAVLVCLTPALAVMPVHWLPKVMVVGLLVCSQVFFSWYAATEPLREGVLSPEQVAIVGSLNFQLKELDTVIAAFDPKKYRTKRAELLKDRAAIIDKLAVMTQKPEPGLLQNTAKVQTAVFRFLLEIALLMLAHVGFVQLKSWLRLTEQAEEAAHIERYPDDVYTSMGHDNGVLSPPNGARAHEEEVETPADEEAAPSGGEKHENVHNLFSNVSDKDAVLQKMPAAVCKSTSGTRSGPFAVYDSGKMKKILGEGGTSPEAWQRAAQNIYEDVLKAA